MEFASGLRKDRIAVKLFPLSVATALCVMWAAQAFTAQAGAADNTETTTAAQSTTHSPNLDLGSTQATIAAAKSGSILVGGQLGSNGQIAGASSMDIAIGQLLTPAQNVALWQSSHGNQRLVVSDVGAAIGGNLSLNSSWAGNLSTLVIPAGVSVGAVGFTSTSPLNVSSTANILGSLFAMQTAPGLTAAMNFGSNLNIGASGLLSGNLPTSLPGVNLAHLFASQNLALNVLGSLTNNGTISAPGTLSVIAGGSIINQTTAANMALMSAQNINLVTGIGQIINSGLIQATGNIDLSTLTRDTALKIDASHGVFETLGAINVRDAVSSITGDTSLTGGRWLSQELNLHSGEGALDVSVEEIAGTLSVTAGSAHVSTNAPMLTLGNSSVSGDPTYVNAGGNIQIIGTISENEDLAIIAAGSITSSGAAQIVNHGHSVWLIAGAKVDTSSGSCVGCGNSSSLTAPAGTISAISSGSVRISASGAQGGNIDLATGNTLAGGATVIDTSATVAGGAGGGVTLVALANGSTGGHILFPGTVATSVNSSGSGAGANGNVRLVAGATSGQAITVGGVTANGGTGNGASLTFTAAQASFTGGSCSGCMSFNSTGTATGDLGTLTTANGGVTINGTLAVSNAKNGGSISASTPTGSLQVTGALIAGDVSLVSASGNVGSVNTPVEINNNGGGLRLFVASDIVNVSDSTSEDISLASTLTSSLRGNTSFTLSTGGNLLPATSSLVSTTIVSPNISLLGSNSSVLGGDLPGFVIATSGASTLTVSGKDIYIRNSGDLQGFSSKSANQLSFVNTGNVKLSAPISAYSSNSITLDGSNNVFDLNGKDISASDAIVLTADRIIIGSGTITSPNGSVSLRPSSANTALNIGGGSTGIQLSNHDFGQIDAKLVSLGNSKTGQINIYGQLDLSGKTYDLAFYQGRYQDTKFTNYGTILLNGNSFYLQSDSPLVSGNIINIGKADRIDLRTDGISLTGNIDSHGGTVVIYGRAPLQTTSTKISADSLFIEAGYSIDIDLAVSHLFFNGLPKVNGAMLVRNSSPLLSISDAVFRYGFDYTDLSGGGINVTGNLSTTEGPIVFRATGSTASPITITGAITGGGPPASSFSIIGNGGAVAISGPISVTGAILVDVGAGSTPNAVTISSAGSLTGSSIEIHGNGGAISTNASMQASTIMIDNQGTGSITGSGALSAVSSITLGKTGYSGAMNLNLSTPVLTFNTTGDVTIKNNLALTSNGSSTGANVSYSTSGSAGISLSGAVLATGSLTIATDPLATAGIVLGATFKGTDVSISAHGSGTITQTAGSINASSSLTLTSDTGDITIATASTPSIILNTTGAVSINNNTAGALSLSSLGSLFTKLNVSTNHALSFGSALTTSDLRLSATSMSVGVGTLVVSGPIQLTVDNLAVLSGATLQGTSVAITGATMNGTAGAAMTINNSGTIRATAGNISVVSSLGQDLLLTGNGSGIFEVTNGSSIGITARDNPGVRGPSLVLGPGDMSFNTGSGAAASFVTFSATGSGASVTINPGVYYDFPSDYTYTEVFTSNFNGGFSQFGIHTALHSNPNSAFSVDLLASPGTIANAFGSIDLSQLSTLKYSGTNLAILSSYDIVNSSQSPITVDLSSSSGNGGSLTLMAGFNFTPTAFTPGPVSTVYTLTGISSHGGSINLGSVALNTSGATSGGAVTAVASQGATSSGGITLGAVTTNGGTGKGGNVNFTGNGISVGSINSTSNSPANSGSVTLTSASSVTLSNPGKMQVIAGAVTGGTFLAGTLAGAIGLAPINAINAGQSSVLLQGGSIAGNGSIFVHNLTLTATTGSINVKTSADIISATASGSNNSSVFISNTGNLTGFIASAAGTNESVSLTNIGNVSLSGTIFAPASVSLILGSGNTLTNNGFKLSSNKAVNLAMDSYNLTGANPLNAGTGTVTITPATSNRAIGLAGGSGLLLTSSNLSGITAGTLIVGSSGTTGGITVGTLDISSKYNVQLLNGGSGGLNSTGSTITLGARSLVINVAGDVSLGKISTAGANIQITGQSITLNDTVGSANDFISLSTTFGNILSSSVITAKSLTMTANGYIGKGHDYISPNHVFYPMETAVTGTLALSTDDHYLFGEIAVNNTGNLTNFSANNTSGSMSSYIDFHNVGDVTLGGDVKSTMVEAKVTITLSAGSTLSLNGYKIEARRTHVYADHLVVGPVAPGDYSIKGVDLQIAPSSPLGVINLGGGVGGLSLSNADLNSFLSPGNNLVIGGYNNSGGIEVWSPINAPNVAFQQADGRTPAFDHLNGGGFNAHGNAVTALWIDCTGGVVTIGAGSKLQTVVGGTVTLEGNSSINAVFAFQGGIVSTGVLDGGSRFVAMKGGIDVQTSTSSLSLLAFGGDITVSNTGNLTAFDASSQFGSVSLTNTGNISLVRSAYSSPHEAQGNGITGVVDVGRYAVYGPTGVSIIQDDASTFTHNSQRILTNNSPIYLAINSYEPTSGPSEAGLLHAGTSTVSIVPTSSSATISLLSNGGTIAINQSVYNDIIAGKLILGAPNASGNISLGAPLDLSSKFSLQLVLGGSSSFNTNGNAITMGAKPLELNIEGPVTLGSISTSSTVKVAAQTINIGSVSTASSMSLIARSGSILGGTGKLSTSNLAYSVTGGVIDVNVNGTPLFVDSAGGTAGGFVVLGYIGYLPPGFSADAGTPVNSITAPTATSSLLASSATSSLGPTLTSSATDMPSTITGASMALNTLNVADANISMAKTSVQVPDSEDSDLLNYQSSNLTGSVIDDSSKASRWALTKSVDGNLSVSGSRTNNTDRIANIFAPPESLLFTTKTSSGELLRLESGSVFLDTLTAMSIQTPSVTVNLKKGALVCVVVEKGRTYVRLCSPTGTASAIVNGRLLSLNWNYFTR